MNRFASVFVLAAVFGLTACAAEEPGSASLDGKYASYVSHVISVADMQATSDDGRALIDMWMPDYGYTVESGLDYSEIDVICPSGRFMTLEQLAGEIGVASGEAFFLYSSGAAEFQQEKSPPACNSPCWLHQEPDRTWICWCP